MSATPSVEPLHVGVNLLWLVPGVVGGSEEYTVRLLTALAEQPPDDIELTLFVNRSFTTAHPEIAAAFPTVVCPFIERSKVLRVAAEASWLLVQARRRHLDLLHHAGGTIPLLRATPSVTTIHDLQPLLLPDNFAVAKQRYLRWRLPPTVRRSRLLITLTEHTKRSIIERFGRAPEDGAPKDFAIVPPGYTVTLSVQPEGDPITTYGIDGPFFLYAAITYPHKNHVLLLQAFALLLERHPEALLVLTGGEASEEANVTTQIERLGIGERVRRVGRVPHSDLEWFFHHAIALTHTSMFEGFGLPVLEAMGHGCPVLAADTTAVPEVAGDAAILLPLGDPAAWATAMTEVLEDENTQVRLRNAGIARVAEFQWAASAEHLADAYRRAASR
jgi:alpha-1,3-rhamnosyl/mannosyltransferase